MTPAKRSFDIFFALFFIVLFAVPIGIVATILLVFQGRPVLFLSDRMHSPWKKFILWKFRTMSICKDDGGVSGGDKAARVTKIGRVLRHFRLDELPQLWNILRGEMTFVGPRPPLAIYVNRYPELYAQVLKDRPGLTGLATLIFHQTEQTLLAKCRSAAETDAVYARRCIHRKARLDLIYQKNKTLLFDLSILAKSVSRVLKKKTRLNG